MGFRLASFACTTGKWHIKLWISDSLVLHIPLLNETLRVSDWLVLQNTAGKWDVKLWVSDSLVPLRFVLQCSDNRLFLLLLGLLLLLILPQIFFSSSFFHHLLLPPPPPASSSSSPPPSSSFSAPLSSPLSEACFR